MRGLRIIALTLICGLAGCVLPRGQAPSRPKVSKIKEGDTALKRDLTIEELQSHLMGFADDFALAIMHAGTTFEENAENPEERARIRRWTLSHVNAAVVLAAGPNPAINLVDLAGMTTLGRQAFEDDWLPAFGARGQQLFEVHQRYENEIWRLVERVLKPEPLQQLREIIKEWEETHPEKRFGAFVGLCDYAKARYQSPERVRTRSGSLFSIFYMDPMAGLDPAMRQLEQTRYFAERSIFYAQRLPGIIRLQLELLLSEFGAAPPTQKAFETVKEFRDAAQRFNDILEHLPERLGKEQRQVIEDFFAQDKLKDKLGEFNTTFNAAKAMAESLEQATRSVGMLVTQFSNTNNQSSTPKRPFDVTDYGTTAEKIDRAAVQLATTLDSLDRVVRSPGWTERVTEVNGVMGRTEQASHRLIERAFWLALVLIAAALVAALMYRLGSRRIAQRQISLVDDGRRKTVGDDIKSL